ncbi:ABC transporter transmembrane region 2 family protein [Clavispora lusitaniae]|uniref:ABC transporter transmembrane region 2 family protein n=1 Tax=Clavispora lusitaniae TaxID=36911 RepID=UPI00202BE6F7|nr:ABC transporter transmembrane region 2 family protein [Clavispora lusitaniae]
MSHFSKSRSDSYARSIVNAYKSKRPILLNISYLLLFIAAFTGATSTSNKKVRKESTEEKAKEKKTPRLSRNDLKTLLKSAVPGVSDSVVGYLAGHIVLLVARAFLTIEVASLDGKLVGALVTKRLRKFARLLAFWMFLGIPASFVNALLNWTKEKMRQSLRRNINDSILHDYLPDNLDPNYYALLQSADSDIKDPDQRISTDVSRLAQALASLPGQLLKPSLDLFLCARELSRSGVGSGEGTLALGLLTHFSTTILRFFSPPFAKLASERASLEGQLRSAHSKVVANNEEIAFLRGHPRELDYVDYCYYQLERFLKIEYSKRAIHEIAQTFIVKYFWGAAGLVLCSAPVFINKYFGKAEDPNATSDFITNRRLLLSASDSIDRLIYSRKYLLQVVGHASRVTSIQKALNTIKQKRLGNISESSTGTVTYGNEITFDRVRLVTPADVTLIESLSFSIKPGQHLLIAGPNGAGKSSMFRMLGGLWPCKEGHITIPTSDNMFYLPQRAYLCKGSLREQITYPHTLEEYKQNKHGKTDKDLKNILDILDLGDLLQSDSDWDAVKNWKEELSTGAQQRLAMARLYYHQPQFAVLDECTSAVTPSMEQFMYQHAQEIGISLISVAHRPALWHFHNLLLKLDGEGGYFFGPLDASRRLKFEEERLMLEKNLRDVPQLRERLEELKNVSTAHHIRHESSQRSLTNMA